MTGSRSVAAAIGSQQLPGDFVVPPDARGVVVFAHGSGSSRLSSRNQFVARKLNDAGLATLLFDLLTADEARLDERTAELRFDIGLLGRRVVEAVDWVTSETAADGLPVGCFGASTGAAAAIVAAVARPDAVRAVVSRGGRPDLAGAALDAIRVPTLLIVGGADEVVLRLNEEALARMQTVSRLEIVTGATHLFEEPGALEQVVMLARDWFLRHLGGGDGSRRPQ